MLDEREVDKSGEQVAEIPVRKTKKMMGWEYLPHGCKVWEINLSDLADIQEAKYKQSTLKIAPARLLGEIPTKELHHQVIIKPGYFYAMASNKKNAIRKFRKVNPGFKQ